jgi:hypothetical protein
MVIQASPFPPTTVATLAVYPQYAHSVVVVVVVVVVCSAMAQWPTVRLR